MTIAMIEKFQCPGCVCGVDVGSCTKHERKSNSDGESHCDSHVLGTVILGVTHFALGLPKGFNRPGGWHYEHGANRHVDSNKINIQLWQNSYAPEWDKLNIAVWAMEQDGYLFVRTYAPRINNGFIDVVEGGKLSLVPGALDVSKFINEID